MKGRQMGLSVMYIVTHLPVTAPWECGIINTEKWKVGIKLKKTSTQQPNILNKVNCLEGRSVIKIF